MSSAQIVSATQNMHSRMAPPVTYGGFWHHPGLGQAQDVKPFPQNPFLGDKSPSSLGNIYNHKGKTTLFHNLIQKVFFFIFSCFSFEEFFTKIIYTFLLYPLLSISSLNYGQLIQHNPYSIILMLLVHKLLSFPSKSFIVTAVITKVLVFEWFII